MKDIEEREYSIEEIAEISGGILTKRGETRNIKRLAPPLLADENSLALALNEDEIENLTRTQATAALVPLGVTLEGITTIEAERPRLAMMKLLHLFYIPPESINGVHSSAVVHPSAKLGENVSIGANVVISRDAVIGNNTKILANTYIGSGVHIGENCLFHAGCNIGDRVVIGNKVILQHGVSIGADGFSFVTESISNVENARNEGSLKEDNSGQKIYKIPSIGSVVIGDDVEIGANTCIDRGTIENTVIGTQTKIDNLVQIGHNCKIGKGCMIVSQVGIAGSCKIGDRVVIAGQAGLADHIEIGSDSIIMAKAGVTKSFPGKNILISAPAMPRKDFLKQMKIMKKVEDFAANINDYKQFLGEQI